MAYAVTQSCCADASCVSVCPVNCIHPTPEERSFGSTEMLHIDPRSCIDCGACADACPVDAIRPVDLLTGADAEYARLNAAWYDDAEPSVWAAPRFPDALPESPGKLRVAVVGTGPSASYATRGLLDAGARVTMLDRLPEAGGLIRFGVAPDHLATRRIGARFDALREHPRVRVRLGVEVGRDVTHDELLRDHHAVLYAVGATDHRRLDVPGETLPGVIHAGSLVGWYNGHPEGARTVPLDTARVVVAGVGNVALDVARVLLTDPEALAVTDIAPSALAALRHSRVGEVVLLGRRGPEQAAFSPNELRELEHRDDIDVVVAQGPVAQLPAASCPRLVLAFDSAVTAIEGDGCVERVRLMRAGSPEELETGLVVPAIGFRGAPIPDLPFDRSTATVPHEGGRVVGGDGRAAYVTGWIKRGPTGGIGANRRCAEETVATLLADAATGGLPGPRSTRRGVSV